MAMTRRPDLIGGHFTVEHETLESVLAFVNTVLEGPDAEHFISIAVSYREGSFRGPSPRATIQFMFSIMGDPQRVHNHFERKYMELLRRTFVKGTVSGDFNNPIYVNE